MTIFQGFHVVRIVLLLVLTGTVLVLALGRPLSKPVRVLVYALLGGALLSYPNFGFFHVYQGGAIHYWDAYHYFMGAKYLPELGYFRLYEATYVAGRELDAFGDVTYIRDLPTYRGRWVSAIDAPAVRRLFSDARWEMFKRDLAFLLPRVPKWSAVFLDHGYNDPPMRALLLHLLIRSLPANQLTLGVLTALDYLLMIAAFALVWRMFGALPAALTCAFLALSFFGRFDFVGGSILRWDWMAAMLAGVAAFAGGYGRAAGTLFAYAILARIFPVLFLAPLAIKWFQRYRTGTPDRTLSRCLACATGVVLAGTLTLAAAGARVPVMPEWMEKISVHNQSPSTNRVGFGPLLIAHVAPWTAGPDGAPTIDETTARAARPAPYVVPLVSFLYLLAILPLILRARPLESMMYAVPMLFWAIPLASYYYVVLALLVLLPWEGERPDRLRLIESAVLAAMTAVSYGLEIASPDFLPLFYTVNIQIGLFFVVWLVLEYTRRRVPHETPAAATCAASTGSTRSWPPRPDRQA